MKTLASILCAALAAAILHFFPDVARTTEVPGFRLPRQAALDADHVGRARVIDGDTIDIAGTRIRLEGIDAPEIKQSCKSAGGGSWPAGRISATSLERWVRGRIVSCRSVGHDGYGRTLGRCATTERNLNAALIEEGLAWAFVKYSHTFVGEELKARQQRKGVWAFSCQTAWDYRANRWNTVASSAPAGCAIKGNITRKGHIYHMPWDPWYSRTRIDQSKGERWFCNERQAQAAGWRPARVR